MSKCVIRIKSQLNHARRSVALVMEHAVSYINAGTVFENLSTQEERYLLKSFEYWVGGFNNDDRFHGWTKSQHKGKYTNCYVFKNVSKAARFYGFLCRPKADNSQYEMCVLVLHAKKKKWKTDIKELQRAEDMRVDSDIQKALSDPRLFEKGVGEST
jgi:hypothetical protein